MSGGQLWVLDITHSEFDTCWLVDRYVLFDLFIVLRFVHLLRSLEKKAFLVHFISHDDKCYLKCWSHLGVELNTKVGRLHCVWILGFGNKVNIKIVCKQEINIGSRGITRIFMFKFVGTCFSFIESFTKSAPSTGAVMYQTVIGYVSNYSELLFNHKIHRLKTFFISPQN